MKLLGARTHLEVPWPPLPWTCPRCQRVFHNHLATIATVGTGPPVPPEKLTPEELARASFLCVACDFLSFTGPTQS